MTFYKPKVVEDWESALPRVCWTCCYCERWDDGHCKKHNANPPKDFSETPGACGDHLAEMDIPF